MTEEAHAAARAQAEQWLAEADALKQSWPEFDLLAEAEAQPGFLPLLQAGLSVEAAYEALHREAVHARIAKQAAEEAERRVVENIRSRGSRPAENGADAGTGVNVRRDVRRLTEADRRDIALRVQRGERITF